MLQQEGEEKAGGGWRASGQRKRGEGVERSRCSHPRESDSRMIIAFMQRTHRPDPPSLARGPAA